MFFFSSIGIFFVGISVEGVTRLLLLSLSWSFLAERTLFCGYIYFLTYLLCYLFVWMFVSFKANCRIRFHKRWQSSSSPWFAHFKMLHYELQHHCVFFIFFSLKKEDRKKCPLDARNFRTWTLWHFVLFVGPLLIHHFQQKKDIHILVCSIYFLLLNHRLVDILFFFMITIFSARITMVKVIDMISNTQKLID